jgi:hypothetical protein
MMTSSSRADLIPWVYSWSSNPSVIHADAPGKSYVTLTDEPVELAVGESDIVATNLRTFSTAPANSPDHFTHAGYSLKVYLYDPASHKSATMVFTGYLDGTLSASNANLANTFTGLASQTVVLGNHIFTANALSYSPPGIPGSVNAGSISGHIMIHIESVVTLSEPASLTLIGLGMSLLGMTRLRRRKRATSEQKAT